MIGATGAADHHSCYLDREVFGTEGTFKKTPTETLKFIQIAAAAPLTSTDSLPHARGRLNYISSMHGEKKKKNPSEMQL